MFVDQRPTQKQNFSVQSPLCHVAPVSVDSFEELTHLVTLYDKQGILIFTRLIIKRDKTSVVLSKFYFLQIFSKYLETTSAFNGV